MGDSQARDIDQAAGNSVNTASSFAATTYVVYLLFPSHKGDHVLVEIVGENEARLPRIRIPLHNKEYLPVDVLEKKVEEAFSYPIYLAKRSHICKEDDIDNPGQKVINDMWEVHPAGDFLSIAEPLKWVHQDDLLSYRWLNGFQSLARGHIYLEVEYLFEVIHSEVEILSKPWETLGFYKRLVNLTQEGLRRKGMVMDGRARVMQDGQDGRMFTCTAKVRADQGMAPRTDRSEIVFTKATFPVAREVQRTLAVASVFGNIVPEILMFDLPWGILVQRDVGMMKDEALDQEALIGTILHMQRVSVKRVGELERKGLRVMDAKWLDSNVESILNHVIFDDYFQSNEDTLTDCDEERETLQALRSKVSEIRRICRQITELGLPNTIVHGDCGAHNIGSSTTTKEGILYRIFDWAKAHIGNPLNDLDGILALDAKDAGGKVDWEAGVRQICGQWRQLMGLPHQELRRAIRSIRSFTVFVDLHELEEQHDMHKATTADGPEDFAGHEIRVFSDLTSLFEHLGHVNERIKPMRRSNEA